MGIFQSHCTCVSLAPSVAVRLAEQLHGSCRANDVQVEFIMLDPYQRITLQHNNEACPPLWLHLP